MALQLAIAIAALFLWPSAVRADPCKGCGGNSEVINPFPISGLRWGTAEVVEGNLRCTVSPTRRGWLAVDDAPHVWLDPTGKRLVDPKAPVPVLGGFQLKVIDSQGKQICDGADLAGIVVVIDRRYEPLVIEQVAATEIRAVKRLDNPDAKPLEARVVYRFAQLDHPKESVCTSRLSPRSWWDRFWSTGPEHHPAAHTLAVVQPDLAHLAMIDRSQIGKFALVLPDADYTDDGVPERRISRGYQVVGDPRSARYGISLEWFEMACGGAGLADTELSGMVHPCDNKSVRTAALYMFSARYRDRKSVTLDGTPIYTRRVQVETAPCRKALDGNSSVEDDPTPFGKRHPEVPLIEARWNEDGAMCMSHARRWIKNMSIDEAPAVPAHTSGTESDARRSELLFIRGFSLNRCAEVADDQNLAIFETYLDKNHIDAPVDQVSAAQ